MLRCVVLDLWYWTCFLLTLGSQRGHLDHSESVKGECVQDFLSCVYCLGHCRCCGAAAWMSPRPCPEGCGLDFNKGFTLPRAVHKVSTPVLYQGNYWVSGHFLAVVKRHLEPVPPQNLQYFQVGDTESTLCCLSVFLPTCCPYFEGG